MRLDECSSHGIKKWVRLLSLSVLSIGAEAWKGVGAEAWRGVGDEVAEGDAAATADEDAAGRELGGMVYTLSPLLITALVPLIETTSTSDPAGSFMLPTVLPWITSGRSTGWVSFEEEARSTEQEPNRMAPKKNLMTAAFVGEVISYPEKHHSGHQPWLSTLRIPQDF